MNLTDLFPVCRMESCPKRGKHKHPLPHQQELLDSAEKYVCLIGGYGSGKTVPACVLAVALSLSIPGNLGVIVRRSYPKLNDSVTRILLEILENAEIDYDGLENRDRFPRRIVVDPDGAKSEILLRDSQDLGRWLGSTIGWFYIDEAVEEPESTFQGLVSRLRLPKAGKYLRGILTTNPPHERHWIPRIFGATAGAKRVGRTTFRLIKSSTRDNPHNPDGYVDDIVATHTKADANRVVEGNFGFTADGPPVYPGFREANVGVPELREHDALTRGWDFGFRHPACSWHQTFTCRERQLHWNILAELDGQQIETERFAAEVIDLTRQLFPDVSPLMVLNAGDAAGAAYNERGPGPIIRLAQPPYSLQFRYRKTLNIDPGLDLIREFLRGARCKCGQERLVVHRRCRNIIEGFLGGYHYSRKRLVNDKPVKDEHYDDFMDSVRYVGENYIRAELIDPEILRSLRDTGPVIQPVKSPWNWMQPDPTPEQIQAEIARVREEAARRVR